MSKQQEKWNLLKYKTWAIAQLSKNICDAHSNTMQQKSAQYNLTLQDALYNS